MTTTADERIEEVREHLKQAQKGLLEVLNPDTWGHNDLSSLYKDKLLEVLAGIVELKKKIR